jgi:hypothetical protein
MRCAMIDAVPISLNQTGVRIFGSLEDAVVRVQPTGAAIAATRLVKP